MIRTLPPGCSVKQTIATIRPAANQPSGPPPGAVVFVRPATRPAPDPKPGHHPGARPRSVEPRSSGRLRPARDGSRGCLGATKPDVVVAVLRVFVVAVRAGGVLMIVVPRAAPNHTSGRGPEKRRRSKPGAANPSYRRAPREQSTPQPTATRHPYRSHHSHTPPPAAPGASSPASPIGAAAGAAAETPESPRLKGLPP